MESTMQGNKSNLSLKKRVACEHPGYEKKFTSPRALRDHERDVHLTPVVTMPLDQTPNFLSQPQCDIPIDPALSDQQDPTRPTCVGDMPPPATVMPSSIITRRVPPRFYCGVCPEPMRRLQNLEAHIDRAHPIRPKKVYGCNDGQCGRPCFKSRDELRWHDCAKSIPKPFECANCGRDYEGRRNAQRHGDQCTINTTDHRHEEACKPDEGKICICTHCKKSFSQPSRLQIHIWEHSDENRRQCCGESFPDHTKLRAHQQDKCCPLVDLDRPPSKLKGHIESRNLFGCCIDQCRLTFLDVKKLRTHMATHLTCRLCGRQSKSSRGLAVHMRKKHQREAESNGNDGYNSPALTLEMGESISQCGAMPARDGRDADPAEDYEDGNLCGDLVSSEIVVAASPTNDDEDEDEDNDDHNDYDYEDSSEDGYRSRPHVSGASARRKAAARGAHQQTGILRKSRRLRRQKGRCEEEAVRTNSPAHPVTEGQPPPTLSLSKDSSLTNVSNDPAPIRRKRDQRGSEEGKDKRTAKRQRTGQKQQASESVATEMGQGQGQSQRRQTGSPYSIQGSIIQPRQSSCGRPVCLDSPAITTPPAEPSSVHSPPSRSLNDSLDADSAKDGEDDHVSSGAFISSETAMVAPGPRVSDIGAHEDGDDVCGAPQQPDSPSQREKQGRQQQQDTFERRDIATEVTAKVGGAFEKIDGSVKGAEVRQREAEEKEENIKRRIEKVKRWQDHLQELMDASNKERRKLEDELKDCQKETQSAAREAKHESQRKRDMAR